MKYSKEFKIGVFVVVVLTASFFVINYLRGKDIFNKEIEIVSQYENVEGLVESAPVFIKGYKAGKVTEVAYRPEVELFKVTCSVKKEFRIPSDSKMTIYAVDIMGGKGVKIDLGTSSEYVEDGGVLVPSFEVGLLDGLAAGVEPLMAKVGNTLDSLSVTVAGINAMLSEANRASLTRTLAHLEKTMGSVSGIARMVDGKSEEISAFIDNIPFVATMIPLLKTMEESLGGREAMMPVWWALSIGSCFGGNGSLIAASANVIVAGIAAREGHPLNFIKFLIWSVPIMLLTIVVSSVYIYIVHFM